MENRDHVLVVGDSLSSDIQGGINAGLDTCWLNRNHIENPGQVCPTYEIDSLEQLYPIVMESDELARVGDEEPAASDLSLPASVGKKYAIESGTDRQELWGEGRAGTRDGQRRAGGPHRHCGPERRRQNDPAQDPDR